MGCDMGSNQFRADIPRLARLYMDGRLNLDDMLTASLPLEEINQGADKDFTFVSYAVLDDEFPDSITACDSWLITGSASPETAPGKAGRGAVGKAY